jgi:hypothetical protein
VTPDRLEAMAQACARLADTVQHSAPRLEAVTDSVLQEASRQRRAGFLRCPGCPECAEPLPLLAGNV